LLELATSSLTDAFPLNKYDRTLLSSPLMCPVVPAGIVLNGRASICLNSPAKSPGAMDFCHFGTTFSTSPSGREWSSLSIAGPSFRVGPDLPAVSGAPPVRAGAHCTTTLPGPVLAPWAETELRRLVPGPSIVLSILHLPRSPCLLPPELAFIR